MRWMRQSRNAASGAVPGRAAVLQLVFLPDGACHCFRKDGAKEIKVKLSRTAFFLIGFAVGSMATAFLLAFIAFLY